MVEQLRTDPTLFPERDVVPLVNQQMGNSGPEDLYRSHMFISAPEQARTRAGRAAAAARRARPRVGREGLRAALTALMD